MSTLTQHTCAIYAFTHQFMQTIILWRIAVKFVQDGTLGQTYESAPTGDYHKFNGASDWVSTEQYFRKGMLAFHYGSRILFG